MRRWGTLVLVGLIGAGCQVRDDTAPDTALDTTTVPQTQATGTQPAGIQVQLMDPQGANAGTATVTPRGDNVEVQVRMTGLTPGSQHGIHFHETGQCDPPSFESAGEHFSPAGRQHGLENPRGPHAGDLPNLQAGQDGSAEATFTSQHLLAGNAQLPAGGLALVVHAQPDDQRTDPSGNSGDRIACGVVHLH